MRSGALQNPASRHVCGRLVGLEAAAERSYAAGLQICSRPPFSARPAADAYCNDCAAAERVAFQKSGGGGGGRAARRSVAAQGAAVGAQGIARCALAAVLAAQVLRHYSLLLHEGLRARVQAFKDTGFTSILEQISYGSLPHGFFARVLQCEGLYPLKSSRSIL